MQQLGQRILANTQQFLDYAQEGRRPLILQNLNDVDEVSDHFDAVVDIMDSVIEKVDMFFR